MQPTYLPWAGYFNLIANVDVFVFLDDAQFQKNSWHSRNRLLLNHQPHWISVPVRHTSLSQRLIDTQVCNEQHWRRKHASLLRQTYARHPHKADIDDIATFILLDDASHLADLNMRLIAYIASRMGITTPLKVASSMRINGRRTERLLNILRSLQVSEYLSPAGAADYLDSDGFRGQEEVALTFQEFLPRPYTQFGHDAFIPYLSIVDVVANLGWTAAEKYVRNSTLRALDHAQ